MNRWFRVAGGKIFDATRNYEAGFLVAAALAFVASIAIATVRPPPPF